MPVEVPATLIFTTLGLAQGLIEYTRHKKDDYGDPGDPLEGFNNYDHELRRLAIITFWGITGLSVGLIADLISNIAKSQ